MSPEKHNRPVGDRTVAGTSFADTNSVAGPTVTAVPIVPVIGITEGRTTRTVTIRCPFCARLHSHGWPYEDGDSDPGHRVAHCKRGGLRGYEIVLSGGAQ